MATVNPAGSGLYRRGRGVGLGSAAGVFLAFGMMPLAAAPHAGADDFGLLDLIDPAAWSTPFDGIDWASFVDPGAWSTVLTDLSGNSALDSMLAGVGSPLAAADVSPAAASESTWSSANVDWLRPFGAGAGGGCRCRRR